MGRSANQHGSREGASGQRAAPPVDLVHLIRHTLGDADLEREALQLFVAHSKVYLNRLKESRNPDQWRQAARTIGGAGRGIGAWRLADCAALVERLGHDVEDRRGREAIVELELEINSVNDYIKSLFLEH